MSRFGGPTMPRGRVADVTLLLEGTYPFVSGGVSSWVHQIIRGLPDVAFSLVFIGGSADRYEKIRYPLPPNVVHLEEHFLSEVPKGDRVAARPGDAAFYGCSAALHDALAGDGSKDLSALLDKMVVALLQNPRRHELDFLFSERSWEQICDRYTRSARDRSFLEYFWTVRSMHAPLFAMARVAANVPPSRSFHVISTGFAGFLATLLRKARGQPLILTEHGIYTKERRIELLQAGWIPDDEQLSPTAQSATIGFFRQVWIRFFESLGKMTYGAADPIVSLYEGNRSRQIRDGADAARTTVVPNGIDVGRFAPLRARRPAAIPRVLGLIGRVVPIKDIKTFIRAMRVVVTQLPDVEGWVVGPQDEDREYALECEDLVRSLGLEASVKFTGPQNVDDIYPKLGLNILTSISEAQPLVVLEAFAAGLPSVTSDVGCCRELIDGVGPDDTSLGSAGVVVDIADPHATARAAIELLTDGARWYAAQRAGIQRVERYYTQTMMLERYRSIYGRALGA